MAEEEEDNSIDWNTMKGYDHGTGPIAIRYLRQMPKTVRPFALHHKSNGTLKDEPSFAVVAGTPPHHVDGDPERFYIMEMSMEMWNKAFQEIGYEIVKKEI